jgi:hypothetical protein
MTDWPGIYAKIGLNRVIPSVYTLASAGQRLPHQHRRKIGQHLRDRCPQRKRIDYNRADPEPGIRAVQDDSEFIDQVPSRQPADRPRLPIS